VRPPDFDCLAYVIRSIATLPGRYEMDILFQTTLEEAREIMLPGVGPLDEAEGGVVLRGFTQDLDWLARYLAGLPWPFVVRQPAELRDALRRHADALVASCQSSVSSHQ
jgi:hypothetical protein